MLQQLEELKINALRELEGINNIKELESWRVRYFGKKSELIKILRGLGALPLEERKAVGAHANEIKSHLESGLKQKEEALKDVQLAAAKREALDITLPGRHLPIGHLHPITQTLDKICGIFISMGFQVVEGPDVEWDYYNFEALNIPEEHPARDTMSTSWINSNSKDNERTMLLRTHTT